MNSDEASAGRSTFGTKQSIIMDIQKLSNLIEKNYMITIFIGHKGFCIVNSSKTNRAKATKLLFRNV